MFPGPLHTEAPAARGNRAEGKSPSPSSSLAGLLSPCMKRANSLPAGIVEMEPADLSSSIRIRWVWSWQAVVSNWHTFSASSEAACHTAF